MPRPIVSVGRLRPRRSKFDLSYRTAFTADIGQLIPVMCDEVVPGDTIKLGNQVLVRFQPPASPVMHEFTASVHYFFLPYRILWDDDRHNNFENFISQAQKASTEDGVPPLDYVLPRMVIPNHVDRDYGSLWDYFGFPVRHVDVADTDSPIVKFPIDMPWRAYWRTVNEYYIDQDLDRRFNPDGTSVLPLNELDGFVETPNDPESGSDFKSSRNDGYQPFNRRWKKDYFTCARPFRQKGQTPALPVNLDFTARTSYGNGAQWPDLSGNPLDEQGRWIRAKFIQHTNGINAQNLAIKDTFLVTDMEAVPIYQPTVAANPLVRPAQDVQSMANSVPLYPGVSAGAPITPPTLTAGRVATDINEIARALQATLTPTTFNVSDLRLAFQTQKWLERNARAGTRYIEFLRAHFDESPSDSRLDRPEYIGGSKLPIFISEVLQTSESNVGQPLGQLGGHGLAADSQYIGSYHVQEYGLILGLFSVLPKPGYQDGINRQWLRKNPTDFYFPEFAHLSEQMIEQVEIYAGFGASDGAGNFYDDRAPFGYTGQYDEMRTKHDLVCNEMRLGDTQQEKNLSYWNLVRKFNAPPRLNSDFIECNPADTKRIFLATGAPGLICNVRNDILAIRPMPEVAEPGMVDHF